MYHPPSKWVRVKGGGLRLTVGAQMGESVEFVEGQSFRNNNTANRQGYGASDPT